MYSQLEILEFQQKDKRIMYQSIFSSLCNLYANCEKDKDSTVIIELELAKRAFEIVEELIKKYPMQEIPKNIRNMASGSPF